MKLLIIISLIACGYAAKLDRGYLPPASAASAGGSPGSLSAPGSGSFGQAPSDSGSTFGRQPTGTSGFGAPSFGQGPTQGTAKPGFTQPGQSGFSSGTQSSTGFGQPSGSSGYGTPSGPGGFGSGSYNQQSGSGQPGQPGYSSGRQPSTAYGQPSGSSFGPSSGPSGFGPSGAGKPTFSGSDSQTGFNQGSTFGQNQGSYNVQAYNQPQRAQAAAEQGAQILRYDNQNDGETFSYSFETSNGIRAEESGVATNGVRAQGGFGYTGDDGQTYSISYTADENGYQPQGDHLPTPHPIPEEILKSIEENARAAASGTQEGAYRPEEYENEGNSQGYSGAGAFNRPGQGPSQQYGPSKFGGSRQGTQGYSQQGSQGSNAFGQNQNQGFGQGNRGQQAGGQGNQYNQQGQYGPSGSAQSQGFGPSGGRGPQGQSSFGQGAGTNQGQAQPFGQGSGSNLGQGQAFGQGNTNKGQGPSTFGQGQSTFGQSAGTNSGLGFGGQRGQASGQGEPGYEYNRPQGSGQFGSPTPGQAGPQGSSGPFSRPGVGSSQGFGPSARPNQGTQPTYGAPSQSGQGSQYRPGSQSSAAVPANPSSPFGQGPAGSQNQPGQFTPASGLPSAGTNQGRPENFGGPQQPPSFSAQEGYKY